MAKTIILYALALALAVAALEWLDYRHFTRSFSTELYVLLLATGFAALGGWVGHRLTRRPAPETFELNQAALDALGLTRREHEMLTHLAKGRSNKEIARLLGLSPNTVKTHLANLYAKLSVARRTQAIAKGRALALIP